MPQIDFYHLKDDGLALAVAMLADKSVASGQKFLIYCPASLTDIISEYLWTARADNFLAHGVDDEEGASDAPVWITTKADANPIAAKFICLLDGLEMPDLQQFDRIFNIFDGSRPDKTEQARSQWKNWSALSDAECRYFAQNERGAWELKR